MSDIQFPKTCQALQDLQLQFKCKSCGIFAESPCTFGGCEHIFCNVCCDANLEQDVCPVCQVHVSVKDAQVNRQIFNLIRLCQRLECVLNDQDENTSNADSPKRSAVQTCSDSYITGTGSEEVSPYSKESHDRKPIQTRSDSHVPVRGSRRVSSINYNAEKNNLNEEVISTKKTKNTDGEKLPLGRKRRGLPENQRTMTQMFCEDSEGEELEEDSLSSEDSSPKKGKGRKRKKLSKTGIKSSKNKQHAIDQTTMSQFFDYIESSDNETDDCHDNRISTTKNATGSVNADVKTQTTEKNSTKITKKSRNLRTRSKDNKLNKSTMDSPQSGSQHSAGAITNRVQVLKAQHKNNGIQKQSPRRSISPRQQRSKVNLNSSLTGSGKKNSDPIMKRNAKGETTLQVAAIKGDIQKVEELLKAGATVNTRDNAGWTPLHEAVHYGHTEVARMLIDHGAMINIPGTENDTPLHDALRQSKLDCVKLLVSRGACTTSRNIYGLTPEDLAVTPEMKAALSTKVTITNKQPTEVVDVLEYQQPCLLPTALSREQKILLQKCATIIQGRVVEDFIPEVTHVVTVCNDEGMCARTFKYMHGVVSGTWIVNFEWVRMCIEFGSKICEEAFEVPGSSQNVDSHAAEKGRLNRKNQLPKLFDGYQFYFHGNFSYPTPDKEDLIDLVKTAGGEILTREPKPQHLPQFPVVPYHAPKTGPLSKCSIIVVRDNNSQPTEREIISSVSVAWLLECIGKFEIQQNINL